MNTILARVFTKPFLVTLLRYALAAGGAWLVANGLTDEGTWEVVGGAVLTIAVALMGGADSVKDKAVIDGKSVSADKLPSGIRQDLESAVSIKKSRSLFDMILGK